MRRKFLPLVVCFLVFSGLAWTGVASAAWEATIHAEGTQIGTAVYQSPVTIGVAPEAETSPAPPAPPEYTVKMQLYVMPNWEAVLRDIRQEGETSYMWIIGIDPHGNVMPPDPRTSELSWVPSELGAGDWELREGYDGTGLIVVDDMKTTVSYEVTGGASEQLFTIVYTPPPCEELPVLDPIVIQPVDEGQFLEFPVIASDPDVGAGDVLTFSVDNLEAHFTDNGDGTGTFSWTPGFDDSGEYSVTFTVTDFCGNTDSEQITITVNNFNFPPELSAIGDKEVDEGDLLEFTVTANDPDGHDLTLSANPPDHFTDNGDGTGTFSWTSGFDDAGDYDVTFTVTDNGTPQKSDSEQITITVNNVNRAPELTPINDKDGEETQPLEFTVAASDPDGNTLTLTANPPAHFTDNGDGTGTFSWTPGVDDEGDYDVTFTVKDNGTPQLSDSETITITIFNYNQPPVASAGDDKTVPEKDPVILDGSGSYDPDSQDTITYLWEQIGQGPPVTLSDPTAQSPTFDAPNVGPDGETLTFELTVTDDSTPQKQAIDTCEVVVTGVNDLPVAITGGDQTVDENTEVTLNGSNSFDPDYGDVITYEWTQTDGDLVTLSDPTASSPTFDAPNVGPLGATFAFELTVTDEYGLATNTADCTVFVTWLNQPPTANAGADQSVAEDATGIMLDGSGSDDPDIPDGDIITYLWEQTGGPDVGAIINADQDVASFDAPNVGPGGAELTFALTVTDNAGLGLPHTDECIVNVGFLNAPPVADAGVDQTVTEGSTVTLDGLGSDDPDIPDGDSITYLWEQTLGGPPVVILSDPTAQQPTFVAGSVDALGAILTFQLTVTDGGGQGQSLTDTVDITIDDNGIQGFPADCITTTCFTGDPVGLRCNGGNLVAVDTSVDPNSLPDEGRPDDLMYGLIGTQIKCPNAGDTVDLTMIFLNPVPDDYTVFKYGRLFNENNQQCEANESWYDFADFVGRVNYNGNRTEVTITLTDGGPGDHNCAPDATIVDPAGIGAAPAVQPQPDPPPAPPVDGGGGGGGCFINTAASGGHGMFAMLAGLMLVVVAGAYLAVRRFNMS